MAILLAEQVTVTETRNEIIENEKIEVDTTYCTQSKNVTPGVAVLGDTVYSRVNVDIIGQRRAAHIQRILDIIGWNLLLCVKIFMQLTFNNLCYTLDHILPF